MTRSFAPSASGGFKGWHVLASMVAFFAVIVAADATLIYKALATFGGVDNANAYRDGVAYNRRIESAREQALLGWSDSVVEADLPGRLTISLSEANGTPVAGKSLVAQVGRPATTRFDSKLELSEVTPGHYAVALPPGEAGAWVLTLSVFDSPAHSGEPRYQSRRRLWLAP